MTTLRELTPGEAHEELRKRGTARLIDVRTPGEYTAVHAAGAINIPLASLDRAALNELRNSGASMLIFICHSGNRSRQAAELACQHDCPAVASVSGGTSAWEREGLPVLRGKGAISLERQVRIAAGSFVLFGTLLGIFVGSGFLGIPLFIGAGLVFSGITDTCGLAAVLSRMPWNRRCEPPSASSCCVVR